MSGRGKGGKGLGKGGAKRHRKVLRDNIQVGLKLWCRSAAGAAEGSGVCWALGLSLSLSVFLILTEQSYNS